jgi:hypothetical protein
LLLQLNLKTGDGRRIAGTRLCLPGSRRRRNHIHKKTAEGNLILTSMIGLENPLRPEVADAIQKCRGQTDHHDNRRRIETALIINYHVKKRSFAPRPSFPCVADPDPLRIPSPFFRRKRGNSTSGSAESSLQTKPLHDLLHVRPSKPFVSRVPE